MKFQRKTELKMGRLDIAPLIDVVLLLLIFFMLTSSFITPAGLRVDLPESSVTEPQEKDNLVVGVSEEGELYLNDELISWDNFHNRLVSNLSGGQDRVLILKADKETRHGIVVRIMSLARELGWERMAIAADPTLESQSAD